jgi:glycosyltransferase involved in cell wall biosynthesis
MSLQDRSVEAGMSIAYFVTEDWYFCSHRLPLAVAARDAGYAVYVITRVTSHRETIESAGLSLIPLALSRRGTNPLAEAMIIWRLIKLYREIRPRIVHHVALKPVIYGSVAAWIARVPATVNAMAGLGYVFVSQSLMARLLRPLVRSLFRALLNRRRSALILQNPDDVEEFCRKGIVDSGKIRLIRGSGVDPDEYRSQPEPAGAPVVLLASRLLWDKGVREFVEAARILRRGGSSARFVLVGDGDDQNPASIPTSQVASWQEEGDIEWWGWQQDMPSVIARSHIVCLPSYREGLPKVLIEAASCGRPIVTTDAPGCREIAVNGKTGFLVPIRDGEALARAIEVLIDSKELRWRMGMAGRELVKREFATAAVVHATLTVYESLIE